MSCQSLQLEPISSSGITQYGPLEFMHKYLKSPQQSDQGPLQCQIFFTQYKISLNDDLDQILLLKFSYEILI